MPDRIELRSGAAPWLYQAQTLAFAAAAILLLTATTPWLWKTAALAVLLLVHFHALGHTRRLHPTRKLVLRLDHSLRLYEGNSETDGTTGEGAWISRWLCVLRWTAGDGSRRISLVCASENHVDDYRRLLVFLRLRVGTGARSPA